MNHVSTRFLAQCAMTGLLFVASLFMGNELTAQVNVTSTGGTMMASYTTLSAAITAVNAGTHTGTITVNVDAGHTETSDIPEITFSGTAANPIVIQKNGAGANPVITRLTAGTVASSTTLGSNGDGIIVVNGGDYITFDGIDLATDASFSGVGYMEYGYYLKKASATDACKNVTIKNCAITLNKAAIYSFGVFVSNISGTAAVTVTSIDGRSENIKVFNNTISNAYGGVQLRGFADGTAPYAFYDQNIEIGQEGGNTISNYGGGASTTYGIYTIYQNNCKLNNNTITGGDGTTSTHYGIFVSTSNNGSFDINNNTISINNSSTTSQVTGISVGIGTTGNTSNTMNINGNTLTNFSRPAATTGVTYFVYSTSNYPFNFNINNNTIGNSTFVGTGAVYGIYQISIPPNMTIDGNVISGITRQATTSTALLYGISTTGSSTGHNAIISNNVIHSLTGMGSTGVVGGISLGTVNVADVFKNKIYNLTSDNASGAVYGMAVSSVTTANIYNNLIGDLKAPTSGSSTAIAPVIRGINITSTLANSNINLSYNTISLNATSSGTNFGSAGVFATSSATATSASLTMRNNIIANNSTPTGVGLSVAFQRSTTALNNYNSASNNNLYYAGVPGAANLIFYDGTNSDQTVVGFKNRVAPADANSITENPTFVSLDGASANFLHINTTVPTQIESGGVVIASITADYDGNIRAGSPGYGGSGTAPDLGADEGNFVGVDLSGPAISYSPLPNFCTAGDININGVNITDATGIPLAGVLIPRVYYRKNGGAWFSQPGTYVSGVAVSSMWNFTMVVADMGGIVVGDAVDYYVIAQDITVPTNIGSTPGGAVATDVNNVTTAPGTPYSVTLVPTLAGVYTVGAGGSYTTLTSAVATYNLACLSGPVTFRLTDATYPNETFPIVINQNAFASATNTLTIRSALGNDATISGSSASCIINLNGADWIIIDGDDSGGGSILTIENTNTATNTAAICVQSLGTNLGATNNVIKEVKIKTGEIGTTTSLNTFGIYVGGTTISTSATGADNDNLTIQGNTISKARYGIYARATATATANDNLQIFDNIIGSGNAAEYVTYRGLDITYAQAPTVARNTIFNLKQALSTSNSGMEFGAGVNDAQIFGNNINGVYSESTSGYGAYGINFASSTTVNNNRIFNNFISDIRTVNYSTGSTTFNAFGIRLVGGTNTKIYNNSINLFGNITIVSGTPTQPNSANLVITSTSVTGLEVWNNIFRNTMSFVSGTPKIYNIWASPAGYAFGSINHNDYYGTDGAPTTYHVGRISSTDYTTLAAWQTYTTQDANSVAVAPNFVSDLDLHLVNNTNQCIDGEGSPYTQVGNDYDGFARNPTRPDIGADEINNPDVTFAVTDASGALPNDGVVCSGGSATLAVTGGVSYLWSSGSSMASITVTPPSSTTYTVSITHSNSCLDVFDATITVSPDPNAFGVTGGGAFCAPGAGVAVGLAGSDVATNYQLRRDGANVGNPVAGTGLALDFGNQTVAGSYTVVATDVISTCTASMTGFAEVTANQTPAVFNMTGGGAYCAPGSGLPVGLSGSEVGVDYQLKIGGADVGTPVSGTGVALNFGNQTVVGAYTVAATSVAGGCTAAMSGSVDITQNETPTLSETHAEPTTCIATNGAINLSVSGNAAPYAYNWFTSNGNGLVQGQEDQNNLTIGTYFVTVTGVNTCSATLSVSLAGPGGCDACPVVGFVNANPTGVCINESVTLTASSLVDMGTTYGITFKYFNAPTSTPYTGGTVIATIPNGNLGNGGASAETTTTFATGGTYYIYAVLDVPPVDPACRPSAVVALPVVNIPTVDPVANQTVCVGASTATVTFSGAVAGTNFNWTNSNPSIGLAAAGSGNIPAFSTLNNGTAPVTATVVVTPVTDPSTGAVCTGTPTSFTITVNPVPSVDAVANSTYCVGANAASVVFTSNVPGATFAWSRTAEAIGLGATSGNGNVPSFTTTNATNAPVTSVFTVVASYTNNGVTCTGSPIQFNITVNPTPTANAVANQTLCNGAATTAVNFAGAVPGTVYNWTNSNASIGLAATGSGNIASFTAVNTGGVPAVATLTITPSYTNNGVTCSGTPTVFTITVNPTAQVNQPANVTTCGGASTSVNFTSTTTGSTFTWTNSNPAIGLAASGSGNISFVATNVAATTTATVTVTPNYTNNGVSCPGTPRTFTITVDPLPTVAAVPSQIWCSGEATTAVNFTGTLANTTFNWTNNNASIGLAASGTGNIPSFVTANSSPSIQIATITVTPILTTGSGSCPGTPITFTYTIYPRPIVNVGPDFAICQDQTANLNAMLSGGATSGSWSGGVGIYGNKTAAATTYLPAASEYGQTITFTFTSNDPAGPCPSVSDAFTLTVNTLPIVDAGADILICEGDNLTLSLLNATITANGSGVSTGVWSSTGTGTFQPNANFPTAQTYTPSAADIAAGFVLLRLSSDDPAGPCGVVSDEVRLGFHEEIGISCNDLVHVSLDVDCISEVNPDDVLEGDADDYKFFTVELFNNLNQPLPGGNVVGTADVGKTYKVKVTDICTGNFCWGNVKVEDKLVPVLTCADVTLTCAITNFTPGYITGTLGIAAGTPTVFDCSTTTLTYDDVWTDLTCTGSINGKNNVSAFIKRDWLVKDAWNNFSVCTQYIYLERRGIAAVKFPADVDLVCTNANTDPSSTGAPFLTDFGKNWPMFPDQASCELSVGKSDQILPVCGNSYKILRTWTVYDWCLPTNPGPTGTLNPKFFIQVIKVTDNVGPTIACPANLTVSTNPFNCCSNADLPDVIISDNCGAVASITATVEGADPLTNVPFSYAVTGSLTTFAGNNLWNPDTLAVVGATPCLPLGTYPVKYVAEDLCGNQKTCSFNITVADLVQPTVACDEFTQVSLGNDGKIQVNALTFDDGSYDNCCMDYFEVARMNKDCNGLDDDFGPQVEFCCTDINDTITVIFRAVDCSGNTNDCMVQVFVDDKLKPLCQAPATVTVSCENFDPSLWAYGFATGEDNCCIDTITATTNYSQFDTLCSRGTITRTFRVFDCAANSTQCTQRVFVNYEQDYFVKFPDDRIVSVCDGTGNFGEPTFLNKDCELLGVSFTDEVFTVVPDACFKIERTWHIINWCRYNANVPLTDVPNPNPNATVNAPANNAGPVVSSSSNPAVVAAPWTATRVAIVPGAAQTDYSVFYNGGTYTFNNQTITVPSIGNSNGFSYKQIIKVLDTQDPTIENCPASPVTFCDLTPNDGSLWNETYWYDNGTMSHNLCEGPTDLTITATDACSGASINIKYLLFLDTDNNGSMETVISSTNLPGFNNVQFNNAQNLNFTGGTPSAFDERPVPSNQKYGFALQTTVSGTKKIGAVRWNTFQAQGTYVVPELPYGTHKIKWIVEDGCGNESICEYTFIVKDCKAPTVVCRNGLSVNIMPTGMIQLWASDFLEYTEDNCTPANKLQIAIRKEGAADGQGNTTGFPRNADGTPQTNVAFNCTELGQQEVELWSIDLAGNADFCLTYVIVQDNNGNCATGTAVVAGYLKTEQQQGLEEADVEVSGGGAGIPAFTKSVMTDQNGYYEVLKTIPVGSNFTVTPTHDANPLNGVSTYDLVLISKHILGLEPLTTPYKMIAADANKSGSITTFDIVEIRKLILGIYTELPNNTSWRFTDKYFAFPDPLNPFKTAFPENKSVADIQAHMLSGDFVAMKIGDVNGSATAHSLMASEDRTAGTLLFDVSDRKVAAGEEFDVTFKAATAAQGYQMTLNLNGLTVTDITESGKVTAANFGIHEGALTVSVDGSQEFTVKFRAAKAGQLSEMLGVSSRITKAEAYTLGNERQDVALRFNSGVIAGLGFELYQNQPNPFVSKTFIGFHLPEAATATLTVYDEMGRTVFTQKGDYAKGYNSVVVERALLDATGVLYYKLETATNSATKQMIQVK